MVWLVRKGAQMKSIITQAQITTVSSRADGSLGLRMVTPELLPSEKTLFFELINHPLEVVIKPDTQQGSAPEVKVDKDLNQKSASTRLRNVLFILWKNNNEGYEKFDLYYLAKMEKIIEEYKEKIESEY